VAAAAAMLAAGCKPGAAATALAARYSISERSARAVLSDARRSGSAPVAVAATVAEPAPGPGVAVVAATAGGHGGAVLPDDLSSMTPSEVHRLLQSRLLEIVTGPLTVLTGKNVVAAAKELARLNGLHTERHLHLHLRGEQGELWTPSQRCQLIADQMQFELGLADKPPSMLREAAGGPDTASDADDDDGEED